MNDDTEEFLEHLNDPFKITEVWIDVVEDSIDPRDYGYNDHPEREEWREKVAGDPDEITQEIPYWIKEW